MSARSVLHVYPARMSQHLARMIRNNAKVFEGSANRAVLVRGEGDADGLADHRVDGGEDTRIVSVLGLCRLLIEETHDLVVFHSAFWPKFWPVALLASVLQPATVWISWGGDLEAGAGLKGWLNGQLRREAVRCFWRVVFLSSADLRRARRRYGEDFAGSVIHYYTPSFLDGADRDGERPGDDGPLAIQVGNDASPVNGQLDCLARLASVPGLRCRVVMPLGYGRFDESHLTALRQTPVRYPQLGVELIETLLSPEEFDRVIDGCKAFLMASLGQRALYSVFRYLARGRPVFLPERSELRADLRALGFEVETLESISSSDARALEALCGRRNVRNRERAREELGLEAIQARWRGAAP